MTLLELCWITACAASIIVTIYSGLILAHIGKRIYQRYKAQRVYVNSWTSWLRNELSKKNER